MLTKKDLLLGNRRTLARAITLVESSKLEDVTTAQQLLEEILPHTGGAIRVAISGVPGVGKSTFIEALGLLLVNQGKKVAVLAVDPSSPISGGSLLGDKTRMEELSRHPNAFIRPTPTSGALGGVAYKTREAMFLCEAAGFDVIFVETVGVGQSELVVSTMVDLFLLLMLPNAGDELQGIKKGIIEVCDLMVINKADGDMQNVAKQQVAQYKSALHLVGSKVDVVTASSLQNINIDKVWQAVEAQWGQLKKSNELTKKRQHQNILWFKTLVDEMFQQKIKSLASDHYKQIIQLLQSKKITVMKAAKQLFLEVFKP